MIQHLSHGWDRVKSPAIAAVEFNFFGDRRYGASRGRILDRSIGEAFDVVHLIPGMIESLHCCVRHGSALNADGRTRLIGGSLISRSVISRSVISAQGIDCRC